MPRSIQHSFILLSVLVAAVLAALLGAFSVSTLISKSDTDAAAILNLTCAEEAASFDELLDGIEVALDVENSYMHSRAAVLEGSGEWLEESEILFSSIAAQTRGVVTYYFEPKTPGAGKGFFYLRDAEGKVFHKMTESDALSSMLPDTSGPDWRQQEAALHSGRSFWLEPRDIGGDGRRVVVYVEPVVMDGKLVGIIGMGVDFQLIADQVESIHPYDSGYAFLTDDAGNVMCHPTIPYGTNLSKDEEEVPAVDAAIAAGSTAGDDVVVYRYKGTDKRMAFHLLKNDMRLVLSVDADEIYAERNRFVSYLISFAALAALVVALAAFLMSRKVLAPIRQMTEAAEKIAAGDLSVELPEAGVAEAESFMKAYEKTVGDLKEQLSIVEGIATHDHLTGFLNKGAFDEMAHEMDERIRAGKAEPFAVCMLDVNGLKQVNDNFGHELGDELLQRAATAIHEAFAAAGDTASFYRLGGDEFAVLLRDGVYRFADLEVVTGRDVSVACGSAAYRPGEDDDLAQVLARADARMYEHKRAGREI